MLQRILTAGVVAAVATAALLFAIDWFRPVGLVRLLAFLAALLVAPCYLAFGFLAFHWTGFLSTAQFILASSLANGALYAFGIFLGFRREATGSKLHRTTTLLSVVWGIPALVAFLLYLAQICL